MAQNGILPAIFHKTKYALNVEMVQSNFYHHIIFNIFKKFNANFANRKYQVHI